MASAVLEKACGYAHKHAVVMLAERGEDSRSFHIDGFKASDLIPVIQANIALDTRIMTDEAGQYVTAGSHFAGHDVVRHGAGEYVRGATHTNMVEGYYRILKRGMKASTSTALRSTCIATW